MSTILKLDNRLEKLVEMCPNTKILADIGCDHGKLAAEIILQSKAYSVIATDISPDSLNKAVRLASKLNISPYISFREGDGFSVISKYDKVSCAVIAGMGGNEILRILRESKVRVNELVIQPMNEPVKLRGYLLQIGFKILEDVIIKVDGKFYNLMRFKEGKMKITDLEFHFGVTNIKELGDDFIEYVKNERNRIEQIRENVGELSQKNINYLDRIEKVLKKYDQKNNE